MSDISSSQPAVGDLAPDFTALAVGGEYGEGTEVTSASLRGRPVVLYFYPKDNTPGCTKQACGLREGWASLAGRAHVFGVSVDSARSHRRFIDKFSLPFPLLVDEEKALVQAFGVWVEKTLYGRKYMGTERTTFVLDAEGRVAAVLPKVKPDRHFEAVLAVLEAGV
ncbi:MAG: peroxiredoxin [Verrucomicrobiales bacterium]|nr:peroxiredoxin [Verrucomicrobiales bacterium]